MDTSKKNLLLVSIIVIVFSLVSFLIYGILSKSSKNEEMVKRLEGLPSLRFSHLNGVSFSNKDLITSTNTILINFNTTCDLCKHEAESVIKNLNQFKEAQILFISPESVPVIKKFAADNKLLNQPKVQVLHDPSDSFTHQLGATAYPYILIYGKDDKLIKRHKGQLNAPAILKLLKT